MYEEQEAFIKEGGLACDVDICDCVFCETCAYFGENIEFKRPDKEN